MAGLRLAAAARQRQAARPVPRRLRHARVPGDRLPLIHADRHRRERRARCLPRGHRRRRRRGGGSGRRFPDSRTGPHPRASAGGRRLQRSFAIGADGVIGAGCNPHTEVERKTCPHGRDRARQDRRGKRRGAAGDVRRCWPGARAGVTHDNGHRVRPPSATARRPGMDTYRRPVPAGGGEATRTGRSAGICPNAARSGWTWLREIVDEADNRPMRVLDY